jgi:hypothetical protein
MTKKNKEEDVRKLNPDIKQFTVGVRQLYDLTIYPLSFSQQMELSDIVSTEMTRFYTSATDLTDLAVITFIVEAVKSNIGTILDFITDPDEVKDIIKDAKAKKLLDVVSNKQLVNLAEIIYQDNFEDLRKKVIDLFEKMPKITDEQSERSSLSSSEAIPSSDSPTSDEVTEKEVLQ